MTIARRQVAAEHCPLCLAIPGQPCFGAKQQTRRAFHQERWDRAVAAALRRRPQPAR